MHTMLSELQIDALKEVSSIGAGNAATALSQMIKKRIVINVPQVQFSTIDEATRVFGPAETIVSAVCLRVLGDVTGIILITFGKAEATRL
ncbi:MAG TPA: chemotaxis protein CheC, partial [bacterium]|nr:chemotaxis protein CheC [bacterium]